MKRRAGWGEKAPTGPTLMSELLPYMSPDHINELLECAKYFPKYHEIDRATLPFIKISNLINIEVDESSDDLIGIQILMLQSQIFYICHIIKSTRKAYNKDKKIIFKKYHQRLNQPKRSPKHKR